MRTTYDTQREYWEQVGTRRHPGHPAVRAMAEPKVLRILDVLPPGTPERTLLEIGAGNGYFSYYLQDHFDLTALDFSRPMLEQNPLPWSNKVLGDAERLPFASDAFDVVFCANLLHHLESPIVALREMARVAKDHVVLVEPNALNPLMLAFGASKRAEWGSLKFFSPYVRWLGHRAGLGCVSCFAHGSVAPNKTPRSWLPFLEPFNRRLPIGLYHVAVFRL